MYGQVREIGGWLTEAQARTLWDEARVVPAGALIVEIGSHQGRSTVVLAAAAPRARVIAVDPFVGGAMFGGAAHPGRSSQPGGRADRTGRAAPE